jgi:hypothetical protein
MTVAMFQGPTVVTGMPISEKNRVMVLQIRGRTVNDLDAVKAAQRNRRNYLARKRHDQRRTAGGRWEK